MRPPNCRSIGFDPAITVFKPRGVPAGGLITVELQLDELEAIRLADYQKLHHAVAGQKMGVSRATFGRILEQARPRWPTPSCMEKPFSFGEAMWSVRRPWPMSASRVMLLLKSLKELDCPPLALTVQATKSPSFVSTRRRRAVQRCENKEERPVVSVVKGADHPSSIFLWR